MDMLFKTNRLVKKIFRGEPAKLTVHDVAHARRYIAGYWKKLERFHPKDDETLLGLPNPYLVPAYEEDHAFDFNEMYYWDSYFMVQGMLDKQHKKMVMGILENLISMQKRFKIIPNASRTYLMGRSQPPLLTSFIFDVYEAYDLDKDWLKQNIAVAKQEYENVWMGTTKPNWRQVYQGLSRYFDINMLNDLAEAESGWDMTTRFNHRALNYLPVDLNALLYKYERDFAKAASILGDEAEAKEWIKRAKTRQHTMDKLMWSDLRKLYFDYNHTKQKRGNVASLASFYPLWAGMVDEKRAAELVKSLSRFEETGGLVTTESSQLNQIVKVPTPNTLPTQWAYPNGWAPLQFIVIQGLRRYGFNEEARRLATKWLATNVDWFNRHGLFLEKYNVVQPKKPPVKGVYPSLTGFGWTNAIFERFCQDYIDT
jgi:alpha,alpha-trehalase